MDFKFVVILAVLRLGLSLPEPGDVVNIVNININLKNRADKVVDAAGADSGDIEPAVDYEIAGTTSDPTCACAFCDSPNGFSCIITQAAPAGSACNCQPVPGFHCSGEVVDCDQQMLYCLDPDTSYYSCLQGGDNNTCVSPETDYNACQQKGTAVHTTIGQENLLLSPSCECSYCTAVRCFITQAAPAGKACNCWSVNNTCVGDIVDCANTSSPFCINPDTSWNSCLEGRGFCGGTYPISEEWYQKCQNESCKCDYCFSGKACIITKATYLDSGNACKCVINRGFELPRPICDGELAKCQDNTSKYCNHPDTSYGSCLQGGGDNCVTPESDYKACQECDCHMCKLDDIVGCKITQAAPAGLACNCTLHPTGLSPFCYGTAIECLDPLSTYCKTPDTSYNACLQGRGDCTTPAIDYQKCQPFLRN